MAERPVGVVGAGYVGLTTAACLAHLGHRVTCTEIDESKVDKLGRGEVPISEPGLAELVAEGLGTGRLRFTTSAAGLRDAEVVFVCVPTPMGERGEADLSALESALRDLGARLAPGTVLVLKSTVPVGTTARVPELTGRDDLPAVSNPEFLREGFAVRDFLEPDRIVLGGDQGLDRVAALYTALDAPVIRTNAASAELGKYASNAFLALKLSYANELAELCEQVGADVRQVTTTMGLDDRIGPAFLRPGPGWGGSCLPKDVAALRRSASDRGLRFGLLRAAERTNTAQHERIVGKVQELLTGSPYGSPAGARIGLLGLTFKAGTDDLRDSPALAIAARLAARGAVLTGYDPAVPAARGGPLADVHVVDDPLLVAKDAAALVVLTEWPEFRELDWAQLAQLAERPAVVDTRNLLDAERLAGHGFTCRGLGVPIG
ncbi:UDP-glucose/GDP-mannose dehydrogenase family protein [Amycolatopsis sp. 195334CR]|uniref:UDP-glucose dehydrogenase family protein n=1 Tax=Amycolatopsis sp. 195334CR TaxID=2814588 RepID=UPI001A8D840E|nr:UDP-glucose/GDP-mannose dehydrogenase family protein [Amycolatopsis sp. 195334CR]MBN6038388.1 UDP-glucose/GDP-mannose dehydrogenase family protein [Amycolatopsis sp. 195334CR]